MSYLNETRKKKTVRKILLIILTVFVIAGALLGLTGYFYVKNSLEPVDENSEEVVEIEIPTGSNRKNIGEILETNDLINSSLIFEFYARFKGDNHFQAGNYLMSPSMSMEEVISYLNAGGTPISEQPVARLTVPEGVDIELIAEEVDEKTDFTEAEFMELIQDETYIEELVSKYPALLTATSENTETRYILEGYLFPATYEVFESTSLESLTTQMVSRMDQAMRPYYEDIEESELNVHEVLTLASYIEREGTTDEDRQLISGVFYNRLTEEMPLQTDPSVSYALGEHRERTTYEDLEIDSPYNTYLYAGVGPGPINSPSESAIEAAVYPEETSYMYFLANLETGDIYFSETYDQHIEYQNEHLRNND